MDTVMEELYHGKNHHTNRVYNISRERKDFVQMLETRMQIVKNFEENFDENTLMQFRTFCEVDEKCDSIEREEMFTYAFRLGARMMLEILSPFPKDPSLLVKNPMR
ncbi:MAG: hypothetical protein K1V97_03235 [Lachnospiraceae bacterium]